MAPSSSNMLGPGFRFHPTDEELVRFYLKRKVTGKPFRFDHIAVVDVYKFEPWDLPCRSKLKTRDLEWYFFSGLDRKYGNGSRTNRATERGYWKTTGKDRQIKHGERTVGMKKTLVYHTGRAPHGGRTNWVMHEYKMADDELAQAGVVQDAFVLCRIFEKSGAGPKNGENYGAPLMEEEWDDDDEVVKVPLLPAADDGILNAVSDGAYVETNDLDKKLDLSGKIGSAGFPASNFYHGECSSHPEHSQEFDKEQKPGTFEISGPQNGQLMAVQDGAGTNLVEVGDNDELSNDALDNVNLYFDPAEYLPNLDDVWLETKDLHSLDDGSFLETNDLMVMNEANPTGADTSGIGMLEEYLSFPDDDITKYISFDFPQETPNDNSIPNQESTSTQQNEEGETADISLANKHNSNNEASSKQKPEESKLESAGNTNAFVNQANKLLASIPAAPAFALEFPTKEIAHGLHPGGQSSNSAHITAGMISITNITLRGNAMDWTVGKNGGFNAIISSEYSQPSGNAAVSGLVSSKTAFVLSHGWIFVVGFSVLILSVSCKIGSIMYSGK
ncbi:hypothetical protein RJT34_23640 [Clitoria ternatea]|uniref:NAC domain-containing protein n=1 Tax=Clitoria ternatea TaxID=43366 RepID=A0AAN9FT44_CLITE